MQECTPAATPGSTMDSPVATKLAATSPRWNPESPQRSIVVSEDCGHEALMLSTVSVIKQMAPALSQDIGLRMARRNRTACQTGYTFMFAAWLPAE